MIVIAQTATPAPRRSGRSGPSLAPSNPSLSHESPRTGDRRRPGLPPRARARGSLSSHAARLPHRAAPARGLPLRSDDIAQLGADANDPGTELVGHRAFKISGHPALSRSFRAFVALAEVVAQPAGDPRRRPTQPELLLDVAAQELVHERVASAMPHRSLARLLMSRVAQYTRAAPPPDTAPPAAAPLLGELLRCSSRVIVPSLRPVAREISASPRYCDRPLSCSRSGRVRRLTDADTSVLRAAHPPAGLLPCLTLASIS